MVALNNNRHTSARAQKIVTLPNMRPLSIREAPRPGGTGVLSPALFTITSISNQQFFGYAQTDGRTDRQTDRHMDKRDPKQYLGLLGH